MKSVDPTESEGGFVNYATDSVEQDPSVNEAAWSTGIKCMLYARIILGNLLGVRVFYGVLPTP